MGTNLSLPSARLIASSSFVVNFSAQLWGMLSEPNMKVIADSNPSAFSPLPQMIGLFFAPQQLLQLYWLKRLWSDGEVTDEHIAYAGTYALGNFCIAAWSLFWHNQNFIASQTAVAINTLSQLAFILFKLPPMTQANWDTHLNVKTFAGIGLLDFVHNGAVAYQAISPGGASTYIPPNMATKILTGIGFLSASILGDASFGACVVYNLLALWLGQPRGNWKNLLGVYSLGAAGIVGLKAWTGRGNSVRLE
ncbi:hypothetical protein FRC03_009122 [Tulasnella sp. 419]|nr:hypothetical protein FRC03_009122 [Tulasnella sp. 419]